MRMIQPFSLSLSRLKRVWSYQLLTPRRWLSESASSGFRGSSMVMKSAATSQNPAYRSREPKSLHRGHELLNRLLVGRETGREQSLIPTGHHGGATITRELIGQLLPIAHTLICAAGSCPSNQAGSATEAQSDFR